MSTTLTAATYSALSADLAELSTAGAVNSTIDLTSTTLTVGALPFTVFLAAGSNLSIIGAPGGTVISGASSTIYTTSQSVLSGSVTFVDVEINDFIVEGNAGAAGVDGLNMASGGGAGGGGAALGGGLFVGAGASVTLDQSGLLGNTAYGGQGGYGGGFNALNHSAGRAGTKTSKIGQYGLSGYAGRVGGYGSNASTIAAGGTGGTAGAGGGYLKAPFQRGEPGGTGGNGGAGANGAFGGGGGGGGSAGGGGGAGYKGAGIGSAQQNGGAGGNGGNGGNGGFGGGGGGSGWYGLGGYGLKNGAKGSYGVPGQGGFGGGNGSTPFAGTKEPLLYNGNGGGGLGAGGAVFVQQGGTVVISGGTITQNKVAGGGDGSALGGGGGGGTVGQALGSGIFLQGNQTLTLDPGFGQSVDLTDGIADQTGSGGTGTNAGAGSLLVAGGGSVTLTAANTFSGGVTLAGGVLSIANAGNLGGGALTFAGSAEVLVTGTTDLTTPIVSFASGDVIEFSTLAFVPGASATLSGTALTVRSGVHMATADVTGLAAGTKFAVTFDPATSGSLVTLACFAAGTRLLTVSGEKPVEVLRVGDLLPTLVGRRLARIGWIGWRDIDNVRAVRISAGAFGADAPIRELVVSPDHALWIGGALVPARALAVRRGIQMVQVENIRYYHIETDTHDVILADGLATETFLDTGNRAAFIDSGRPASPLLATARREARACAPLRPRPCASLRG